MEKIGDRLLKLRKELNLSMAKFGEPIDLSGASINQMEKGQRDITKRTLKSLERVYNVNLEYLQTGEEEMFNDLDTDAELAHLLAKLIKDKEDPNLREFKKALITEMLKLDDLGWRKLERMALSISEKIKKETD